MQKEYIEREALIKELQEEIEFDSPMHNEVENDWLTRGLKIALKDVKRFPPADVVPKSEVEPLQAEVECLRNANADLALALLYECEPTKEHLHILEATVREKVESEIFAEIEKLKWIPFESEHYVVGYDDIAELKKKYTEEKNDED